MLTSRPVSSRKWIGRSNAVGWSPWIQHTGQPCDPSLRKQSAATVQFFRTSQRNFRLFEVTGSQAGVRTLGESSSILGRRLCSAPHVTAKTWQLCRIRTLGDTRSSPDGFSRVCIRPQISGCSGAVSRNGVVPFAVFFDPSDCLLHLLCLGGLSRDEATCLTESQCPYRQAHFFGSGFCPEDGLHRTPAVRRIDVQNSRSQPLSPMSSKLANG
jgi:hypothetical protein